MVNDDVCTIFGCYFWVEIIFVVLIWIGTFCRDNCFYQCVAIVGSQITFFYCLVNCLHQCFANIDFFRWNFQMNDTFILCAFLHTYFQIFFTSVSVKTLVFRSRIEIIIWTVMIFLVNIPIGLTFHLLLCSWQNFWTILIKHS